MTPDHELRGLLKAFAAFAAALIVLAITTGDTTDHTLARDRACLETLHGHPTPLGCRLPDGTTVHPQDIPTEDHP